jgi:hypothetical protein
MFCKFCNKECKNKNSLVNHERLCPANPDRKYVSHTLGKNGHVAWNKGLTKKTSSSLAQLSETHKRNGHGGWSKKASSNGGKAGGGYRENAGRSKKFKVVDSFGKSVCLQSTYELRCSQLLNDLDIKWIRPSALKYDSKNYFPDFYLPEHDLYLDPKNNYKAKLDADKINKVKEQNNVRVVILTEGQLTQDYIKSLCS